MQKDQNQPRSWFAPILQIRKPLKNCQKNLSNSVQIMKWWSLDSSPECQMGTKYPDYLYEIENNKVIEKIEEN